MTDRLTPDEARERLVFHVDTFGITASAAVARILATTDALAVLVTWPALLAAGERVGKVRGIAWCHGRYQLTDPEAAS